MKEFTLVVFAFFFCVSCTGNRADQLRAQMLGQWATIDNSPRLTFTCTDTTFFVTGEPNYFFSNNYQVDENDTVTFVDWHKDTLKFKLSFHTDTMILTGHDEDINFKMIRISSEK